MGPGIDAVEVPIRRFPDGWCGRLQPLGGRLRAGSIIDTSDFGPGVGDAIRRHLDDALIVWTVGRNSDQSDESEFWVAVCRKILDRSAAALVPPEFEAQFDDPPTGVTPDELIDAAFHTDHLVDRDTWAELHETWERPFWESTAERFPYALAWLTPQVSLEALAGQSVRAAEGRWVDFLWYPPPTVDADSAPIVIEIDGSGHRQQADVDADRDRLLKSSGISVGRVRGEDVANIWDLRPKLASILEGSALGPPRDELLRELHGPAVFRRLAEAVLVGVEVGHLRAASSWRIEVSEPLGVAKAASLAVEELLRAVDQLWGTAVVPEQIDWTFTDPAVDAASKSDLLVRLEPFVPPHASLERQSHRGEVVVRSNWLPMRVAQHRSGARPERRQPAPLEGARPALRALLRQTLGHPDFREGQIEPIHRALQGDDSLVLLPTGSGKSLIYTMAGLLQPGIVVVVDPITALIDDQVRRFEEQGIDRVLGLHSSAGLDIDPDEVARRVGSGAYDFVFVTPERFQVERFRSAIASVSSKVSVALAVVDEAHCVSEWGHDFRPAYLRLARNLRRLCRRSDGEPPAILALTATASPTVLRDLLTDLQLRDAEGALFEPATHDRPNLRYMVSKQWNNLPRVLNSVTSEIAEPGSIPSGIVFCPTVTGRVGIEKTVELVERSGVAGTATISMFSGKAPSKAYERDWDSTKRTHARKFVLGESAVMVSTKAFGMGIDKPDIRYTIHRGLPSSIEAFAQEAGRAGRDGNPSLCCLVTEATKAQSSALDPTIDIEDRRELKQGWSDLGTQLFFHYNSFGPLTQAIDAAIAMLDSVWGDPGASIDVAVRDDDDHKKAAEFALIRLMRVGIVADYTKRGRSFRVQLATFDRESIDEITFEYVTEIDMGRNNFHRRHIDAAPAEVRARAEHHLRWAIEQTYRTIEPARLRALAEMHRLASSATTDAEIRGTINAYLGEGMLRGRLHLLIDGADELDVAQLIVELDVTYSPLEWAGSAARQLEATPDHPAALCAAAMGEMLRPHPDLERFSQFCRQALEGLPAFGASDTEQLKLFRFLLDRTRQSNRTLMGVVWRAAPASLDDAPELVQLEDTILRRAQSGGFDLPEVGEVLARHLRRSAALADQLIPQETT